VLHLLIYLKDHTSTHGFYNQMKNNRQKEIKRDEKATHLSGFYQMIY